METPFVLSEYWQYSVAIAQIISAIAVVGAVVMAIKTLRSNADTAKKSLTATFLFESKHDNGYWEGHKVIRKVSESKTKSFIFYLEDDLEAEDAEDRRHIHYYLNFFERVAVSVKGEIYNEDMLKKVFYSTAVKNYESAEPFIRGLRTKFNSQTYYQEYEWLVKRWQKSPLKSQKNS
ncbi:DUF4760 domain-containing protein [Providencia rettgeri]|nr:DUF4760 domain-containing protein [Providencia rettgeri]EIJ7165474.1 DUF4760 domain-containing protein [Providencia rettgeri]